MPSQPQPGDLLLLSGISGTRKPNKLGQAVLRFRKAKHSHVAIAYNAFMIADATPEEGVCLRAWRDASEAYDLRKSVILRPSFSIDIVQLQRRIDYFLRQPYRILSILDSKVINTNGAGMVCSQFASLVFSDIGIRISPRDSKRCLPLDIFDYLRLRRNWRSFQSIAEPSKEPDISWKLGLVTEKIQTRTLELELQFSIIQQSFNELAGRLSAGSWKSFDDIDIEGVQSLLNALDPRSDGRRSDALVYLDLWEKCFLLKTVRTEVKFLNESSDPFSPWIRTLLHLSNEASRVATEVLPDAAKSLHTLITGFTELLRIAGSAHLEATQMTALFIRCEEVAGITESMVKNLDELLLGYGEASRKRSTVLLAKVFSITPPRLQKLALDCLEGHYFLSHRSEMWAIERAAIEKWVHSVRKLESETPTS